MPWIGTSFLSQSHLIFILVISALTGVCGKATNALNLTHVAPCYNADNLELAILMDESASIDHWNKKERYIIKELIRRLYEYFPNMKIAMAVYCVRQDTLLLGHLCVITLDCHQIISISLHSFSLYAGYSEA